MIIKKILKQLPLAALLIAAPLLLAVYAFGVANWDYSIPLPLSYDRYDGIWQLVLTKFLVDTQWVFVNPYLGAPGIADWHYHPAAQSSALHSVLMLVISKFVEDPVRVQQFYYFANFPLICLTSFVACRLLGIRRLPAFCIGMLYAFAAYRLNFYFYAYLANYFAIPLALTAVIWILSGRFARLGDSLGEGRFVEQLLKLAKTKEFLLGLLFVMMMASSDGYYAFFTLLLLGFSFAARVALGDWKRPVSLMPVVVYIVAMMVVALSLQLPMKLYKQAHQSQFQVNGVEDPAMVRHPFEAEIYSDTLKMMLTPPQNHRLESVRALATKVVGTSTAAQKYPHPSVVHLGTIATSLFVIALFLIAVPGVTRGWDGYRIGDKQLGGAGSGRIDNSLLSLAYVILLCSIVGGIGTIIALAYPSIRAYQRFPLFLIFVLYVWAGLLVSTKLADAQPKIRRVWMGLVVAVTVFGLWDQIPVDVRRDTSEVKRQFLAERDFVHGVEAALPDRAMVYQYPYSQYLTENKYYGWGAFYHLRLYMHSRNLHWSNGGAKNSPADDWNARISALPLEAQIVEVEAAGFKGIVIDGVVLDDGSRNAVWAALGQRDYAVENDQPSKLSFARVRDPGYRISFNSRFDGVDHIQITDRERLLQQQSFSLYVNGPALKAYVQSEAAAGEVIKASEHPELFVDSTSATLGMGYTQIPKETMKGQLGCAVDPGEPGSLGTVVLTLSNQSEFDWRMDNGAYPIRIGAMLKKADDTPLWDVFRVSSSDVFVRSGTSQEFRVALEQVLDKERAALNPAKIDFAVVQDANAWYFNISCSIPVAGTQL